MTIQEINNLNFESSYYIVLSRMLDFTLVPQGENSIILDPDETKTTYSRINLHSSLGVKPTKVSIVSEIDIYKNELLAIENSRLLEIARIEDLNDRLGLLNDFRSALIRIYPDKGNPALYRKQLLDSNSTNAEAMLVALEAEDALLKAERDSLIYIEDRRKAYPSLADQLDMQYHDSIDGTNLWKDTIAAIKLLYPKP